MDDRAPPRPETGGAPPSPDRPTSGAASRIIAQIAQIVRAQVPAAVVTIAPPLQIDPTHILDVRLDDHLWTLTCDVSPPQDWDGDESTLEVTLGISSGHSIRHSKVALGEGPDICVHDPILAAKILVSIIGA